MKTYKMIIWGLGHVGKSALKHIQFRKSLELVGVYDLDPNKVSKDVTEIAEFDKKGIIASNDREALLAKEADEKSKGKQF